VCVLCLPGAARAGPPSVDVVVLAPAPDDLELVEAATRTRLELRANGFTSALVDAPGDEIPARVAFVREDDVATIDLVGILPDGTPLHRRVAVPLAEGGDDASVLALRAVELLRGIHLDVHRAPRPARPSFEAPDPDIEEPPAPPPPEVRFGLGLGVLEGRPWGASLAAGFVLSAAARVLPHVSFISTLAGPFANDLPATNGGSAHTREELGFVGLRIDRDRARLGPHGVFGVGLHHLVATYDPRGIPAGPPPPELRIVAAPSIWTPFVAFGAGFGGRVWRRLGASVEVIALLAQPGLDVVVNGRTVGTIGAPSLLETLSAWVAFP
jgi:hypothetical protein